MLIDIKFSIDKAESDLTGTLAISTSVPLTLDALRQAVLHKELLQLLHSQEVSYQSKQKARKFIGSNTPLSLFHVSFLATTRALELLAATHAFYFNGKPIVCDFYGNTEFYFFIEGEENSPIQGKLKTNSREFSLSECAFICSGAHHYYIHGVALKPIITEVSWKDLRQLYLTPEKVSLNQIQKNYQEEENNPLLPKIIFGHETVTSLPKSSEPLPLLCLSDRLGAFANLWMNYPLENSEKTLKIAFHDPSTWIKNSKGRPFIKRQLETEKQWEKDLLETDFVKKIDSSSHYYCPVDCVSKSLSFLLDIGWQLEDSQGRRICRLTDSKLEIHSLKDAFIIKGGVQYGDYQADLKDVVGAFNRKERFIEIGSQQVGLLPSNLEGYGLNGLVEEGEFVQEGIKLRRSRIGALSDLFESKADLTFDDTFANLKEKLSNFQGIQLAKPAPSFKGSLRPYQQDGVNWLSFLYEYGFHGLLADDMGLGKTVQVLAFLSLLKLEHPVLIVLPTSLIFNWKHEIENFLPQASIYVYQGMQRNPWPKELAPSTIILTSYTTLRIDLPLFQSHFYECIILDEAQTIKNSHTQTAQAVYRLEGRFRLSLTGTPIENHISELWAHFRFLIPDLFGEEKKFLADVAASDSDFRYLQKIRQKMKPFVLRRKKEEVAQDLPERIEQIVYVEMDPSQRQLYENFLGGFKQNLLKKVELEGLSKYRIEVLEAILRLRQICCHPLLVSSQSEDIHKIPSAKMEALFQDLETIIDEGRKVLIYSQFTSMLKLIAKEVQNRDWQFVYLDGQTKDREHVVKKFQEDPSTLLFLISLKTGGIGLNLTAADYVFLFDPWWNEAVENQAIDRAHRIGRKDTVIAKRFVTVETIEEKMMALKASKRSLLNDVLHDQIEISQLSLDDLHYLID